LENRGSEDDEVSREMWEAMETDAGEIRLGEAERRRSKGRSRKEERRERSEEEVEKREDNGG